MKKTGAKVRKTGRKNWNTKRLDKAEQAGAKFVIGIDEVGRGPLAGPVAVCAFRAEISWLKEMAKDKKFLSGGFDSKKLTEKTREHWYQKVLDLAKQYDLDWHISYGENESIDNHGLSLAIKNCIKSCLLGVGAKTDTCHILLDGSLKADGQFKQETIIGGDAKELAIALASIMAKVERDRLMVKMHDKYPKYSFHEHKGYGTKKHLDAIRKHGPSPIHRKSFLKKV